MIRILTPSLALALLVAVLMTAAVTAGPPSIEMIRSTIDGGGVMFSAGGDFELSGTIGQPDAGRLAGGTLELTGGFWFALGPGDCNDDGAADLSDLPSFEECTTGPGGPSATETCRCYDLDGSGRVDLLDFAAWQSAFAG
jgi:hypothetical protein